MIFILIVNDSKLGCIGEVGNRGKSDKPGGKT